MVVVAVLLSAVDPCARGWTAQAAPDSYALDLEGVVRAIAEFRYTLKVKATTTRFEITATASIMRRRRFQRLRSGSKKICCPGIFML